MVKWGKNETAINFFTLIFTVYNILLVKNDDLVTENREFKVLL